MSLFKMRHANQQLDSYRREAFSIGDLLSAHIFGRAGKEIAFLERGCAGLSCFVSDCHSADP
jgi:hypothetical protein